MEDFDFEQDAWIVEGEQADLDTIDQTFFSDQLAQLVDREGNPVHPIFLDQIDGSNYCDDCYQDLSE